ncbi:MAG: methionine aminotransferase [Vicinamibacterales bacterium]
MALVSKLPSAGVTIFTVMSKLAADTGAINLGQGFPDFDCDPALVDAVAAKMHAANNQYCPMPGQLALREALAAKIERLYGRRYDAVSEITVTSGATEALFCAITALVHPGDEVIVLEPAYDSYVPAIQLSGGRPVFVTLRGPDYRVDWDAVRRALTPKTRLILLNSPHNPTGTIFGAEDLAALRAVLTHTDAWVASDEVYEHIVFDGRRHESLARDAEIASRTIVISSFGKTYHTTGWKVGYTAAPAALTAEIRNIHQWVTFTVNSAIQLAYADLVTRDPDCAALSGFYQAKRDLFLSLMEGSRFRPLPSAGTFFQLMDYGAISGEADRDFAIRVTKEHGVASIPLSPFLHTTGGETVVRFCFAKKDATLRAAAERLRRI